MSVKSRETKPYEKIYKLSFKLMARIVHNHCSSLPVDLAIVPMSIGGTAARMQPIADKKEITTDPVAVLLDKTRWK